MLLITKLGDIGIAVGLERRGTGCYHEHGEQEHAVRGDVSGRHGDERAKHEQSEAHDDATLVAKLLGHDGGGNGHHKIGTIVGNLQQARLGTGKLQVVGHGAVQGIDQVHGQAPDEEQRSNKDDGDGRRRTLRARLLGGIRHSKALFQTAD